MNVYYALNIPKQPKHKLHRTAYKLHKVTRETLKFPQKEIISIRATSRTSINFRRTSSRSDAQTPTSSAPRKEESSHLKSSSAKEKHQEHSNTTTTTGMNLCKNPWFNIKKHIIYIQLYIHIAHSLPCLNNDLLWNSALLMGSWGAGQSHSMAMAAQGLRFLDRSAMATLGPTMSNNVQQSPWSCLGV